MAQVKLFGNTILDKQKSASAGLKFDNLPNGCDVITDPSNPVYGTQLAKLGPTPVSPVDYTIGIWKVAGISGNAIVDMNFYQGYTTCAQHGRALLANGFVVTGERAPS